jgi:hypothetical protein
MMKITFSVDEKLIAAACARALLEQTTLDEQFRRWLADYANIQPRPQQVDARVAGLRGKLQVGRRLSRGRTPSRKLSDSRRILDPPRGNVRRTASEVKANSARSGVGRKA